MTAPADWDAIAESFRPDARTSGLVQAFITDALLQRYTRPDTGYDRGSLHYGSDLPPDACERKIVYRLTGAPVDPLGLGDLMRFHGGNEAEDGLAEALEERGETIERQTVIRPMRPSAWAWIGHADLLLVKRKHLLEVKAPRAGLFHRAGQNPQRLVKESYRWQASAYHHELARLGRVATTSFLFLDREGSNAPVEVPLEGALLVPLEQIVEQEKRRNELVLRARDAELPPRHPGSLVVEVLKGRGKKPVRTVRATEKRYALCSYCQFQGVCQPGAEEREATLDAGRSAVMVANAEALWAKNPKAKAVFRIGDDDEAEDRAVEEDPSWGAQEDGGAEREVEAHPGVGEAAHAEGANGGAVPGEGAAQESVSPRSGGPGAGSGAPDLTPCETKIAEGSSADSPPSPTTSTSPEPSTPPIAEKASPDSESSSPASSVTPPSSPSPEPSTPATKRSVEKSAILSPDRKHRYVLTRTWDPTKPPMVVIGLNPSTADETKDDATIRRVVSFSKREGLGGLVMLNLFAFRSTDPDGLLAAEDPIGPENDDHIRRECSKLATVVVVAWGGVGVATDDRVEKVLALVWSTGSRPFCFGRNGDGTPKHPLYLKADTPLEPFTGPAKRPIQFVAPVASSPSAGAAASPVAPAQPLADDPCPTCYGKGETDNLTCYDCLERRQLEGGKVVGNGRRNPKVHPKPFTNNGASSSPAPAAEVLPSTPVGETVTSTAAPSPGPTTPPVVAPTDVVASPAPPASVPHSLSPSIPEQVAPGAAPSIGRVEPDYVAAKSSYITEGRALIDAATQAEFDAAVQHATTLPPELVEDEAWKDMAPASAPELAPPSADDF